MKAMKFDEVSAIGHIRNLLQAAQDHILILIICFLTCLMKAMKFDTHIDGISTVSGIGHICRGIRNLVQTVCDRSLKCILNMLDQNHEV